MTEGSLELLANRGRNGLARNALPPEPESDEDDCQAFGYVRGVKDRVVTLELRFANGNSQSFPYSWLGTVIYNPSHGLLLKFVGDVIYLVLIEGSNLNALVKGAVSLYDRGINRHRVVWIREMTRQQLQKAAQGEVTIDRIRTVAYRQDDEPKNVEWLEAFANQMVAPS